MKENLTELVFILDRSGSMGGLEADTIGGFNAMLARQKETSGEAVVTTILFNDSHLLLHDRTDIRGVSPISSQDYFVGGSTALLDAIGLAIQKIGNAQKHMTEEYRAARVVVVITTDGQENASREFTVRQIRHMINRQQTKYGWELIFLGANIDAIATASEFGIKATRAANYHADSAGIHMNFNCVGETLREFRTSGKIDDDWKKTIDEEFMKS